MNEKCLHTLEYDKIRALLVEKCETPLGREEAEKLVPLDQAKAILKAQEETSAALSRVCRDGSLSCSGARDIRDSLLRLRVQANLGMAELLSISSVLRTAARVKAYGARDPEDTSRDILDAAFESLDPVPSLSKEIDRCILSEEEMADDASPALKSIRRKLQAEAAKVHTELNGLLASQSGYLRENVVTMRNGRYCIPVKSEYKSKVPGMIHDESGSGSTVFVEPLSVIRLNNEIRQLEIEEEKEIEVILARLSALASGFEGALSADLKVLSHLDFVFAKAALAREMKAVRPVFNEDHKIYIHQGRHPLLNTHKVVPIDLSLGDSFCQLIITGPNTGGKTVSLKTLGLFQLMGQAGLHIPAFEDSCLGIFTEIYADIGDEQSIEQSLSTFSSHMKNIVGILNKADQDSLVLLDELCAGTDPQEGAALAIAMLSFLKNLQVRTMATTHYSELKVYALSTDGVENASCEFNVGTLSPTYRLLIGIPGKSNAFAISQKLGVPAFIIDDARKNLSQDTERFEDVIKNLEDARRKMEKDRSRVGQMKGEARKLKEDLEKQEEKLNAERDAILKKARAEARDILQEAKNQVDETIRTLNRQSKDVRELEKVRTETRIKIEKNTEVRPEVPIQKSATKTRDLHIGDGVQVLSMNGIRGTVSTLPDQKGNLFVQMGIMRTKVHLSDVVPVAEETVTYDGKARKTASASSGLSKAMTISPEINLIGKTVDEAIPELDKYLDDAYLSGLPSVRVVHGKGSGALRQGVQNHLRRLSYVKSFHLGEYGEGDAGVTIVEFKG